MKTGNKLSIKTRNQLKLRTALIYSLGLTGIVSAITILITILLNIGINDSILATNEEMPNVVASKNNGDWSSPSNWNSLTNNSIPDGKSNILIEHPIHCEDEIELTGYLHIKNTGKLVINKLHIKKGGELKIDGELYVDKLTFSKGSIVSTADKSIVVINEEFKNCKKSDNIYIDGVFKVFGNFYNESQSEIYGNGQISIDGDFIGTGLEYAISPIVNINGKITQTEKAPINILHFQAVRQSNTTILKWTTQSENNNNFFTVERSLNGIEFEEIGVIYSAGFSENATSYIYEDNDIVNSKIIFYRLKQTTFDGSEKQLNTIIAEETHANKRIIDIN